jgi:hypothetical protein
MWGHIAERLGTREGQIGAGATLTLALLVWRFGKPWLAALLLTAVLITLETMAGRTAVYLVLRGIVLLVLSASIFWTIQRSRNLLFTLALAIGAAGIFLY